MHLFHNDSFFILKYLTRATATHPAHGGFFGVERDVKLSASVTSVSHSVSSFLPAYTQSMINGDVFSLSAPDLADVSGLLQVDELLSVLLANLDVIPLFLHCR